MKRVLNTETFVVLGEGLAAGAGHFSLSEDVQEFSFPALVAEKMDADFEQPLLQPPGVGNVGFQDLPAIVPDLNQTTVLKELRDEADLGNLSVPGFRVADALERRPRAPVVWTGDAQQTLTNLVLGVPGLTRADKTLPTQVEYAKARKPTFVLVCLGYQEVLEPLADGYLRGRAPADWSRFAEHYGRILDELGGRKTTLLVTTIPNPLHTAYFSDLETAARILRTEESFLKAQYGFADGDLIRLGGLVDLGYEFLGRQISKQIPAGAVVTAAEADKLTRGVDALNDQIRALAEEKGAYVYDLHGFLKDVADDGVDAAGQTLTADYLGGFYLLNGVYPGRTGHALIANDVIAYLNAKFGKGYSEVDVAEIRAGDGNAASRLADGPTYTDEYLKPRTAAELPPLAPADPSLLNVPPPFDPAKLNIFPIQTTYPYPPFDIGGIKEANKCVPKKGVPAGGLSDPGLIVPLKLPDGLEQTLPLNKAGSYFGDALRAVDFPGERPFLPGLPGFGASGNTFFGGLAMTDSHVTGKIHVRFSEPDEDNVTRFELSHPGGLVGDDGTLAAPQLFKMPSQLNRVIDIPGLVSAGDLNLDTGIVTDFRYAVIFRNTPTMTLLGVNPRLPSAVPLIFPGPPNTGSSWIRFEQRADGKLDVTLAGNLFLPLGEGGNGELTRFPLPFGTPDLKCASIVARGTSLHPHIHLTTKEHLGSEIAEDDRPQIPVNTVREYTPFVHNTNFGDVFGLNIKELEGEGTGRSHLLGRLRLQFGPRSGDTVPVAIAFLPPGGLLSKDPKPLPYLPPGTSRGMVGFNEQLVFPSGVTYNQTKLSSAMDPLNLPVCAVNLKTGHVLDELLYRSFVVQQLFVNLTAIEPCTPGDSFLYQGPARFERGPQGETILAFNGEVFIPYPKGFRFPSPSSDGNPPYVVFRESRLDPFLRFVAMEGAAAKSTFTSGANKAWIKDTSSIGQEFQYRYSIPSDPQKADEAFFEYTNEKDKGTFTLKRLSWVRATNSRDSEAGDGEADTITFGGFGTWSKDDDLHQVSVQISTSATAPYVGIQIDGGTTSNVNTKPKNIDDTLPFPE